MSAPTREPSFEFDGAALCLDFANTVGDRPRCANDRLSDYGSLVAWGRQAGVLAEREAVLLRRVASRRKAEADSVFRRAIEVRESVYRILSSLAAGRSPARGDLATFNEELRLALGRLCIDEDRGSLGWRWKGPRQALDRMLWPVLRSAAELVTSDRLARVGECDSANCSWLFVDRSPAGRRRWCDMKSCGNRDKARRFYRRSKRSRA